MADLEKLVVKLEADISGLQASLQKGSAAADRHARAMEKSFEGVDRRIGNLIGSARLLSGGAIAGLVTGFATLQNKALSYADALKEAGVQTNFGVEALQELRYGNVQLGLSVEQTDQALRKLNLNIGQARSEGMATVPVFGRLNVSLEDVEGRARSNEEIFRELIRRLQGIEDPTIRAAEAFELFGKEAGPRFLELIAAGTKGLDDHAEAARNAGAVLKKDYVDALAAAQDRLEALDIEINASQTRLFGTTEPLAIAFKNIHLAVIDTLDAVAEAGNHSGDAIRMNYGIPVVEATDKTQALVNLLADLETRWNSPAFQTPLALPVDLPIPLAPPGMRGGDQPDGPSDQDKKAAAAARQATEDYIADWQERVEQQKELERELGEFHDQELEDERARSEEYVALWWDKVDQQMDAEEALAQFQADKDRERYGAAKDALGNLSTLLASHSRKAFEVGKAAAIAETIINTFSSAQKAFDALADIPYVGPALGAAAAAAAIAGGMARVQAIKSTQFGSRSVSTGVGGGLSVGSGGGPNGNGSPGSGPGTNVYLRGLDANSLYTGRQLIDLINLAQGDGSRISVVG